MAEDRLNLPFTGLVSFMRVPAVSDFTRLDADIAILGTPTDEGSPWKPGARFAPRRLVLRIATDDLPFGGTWTYEIAAVEGGATLRITEDGFVKPALFRFMARFIFGHTATIEQYLKDLGKKFGEDVTPEP